MTPPIDPKALQRVLESLPPEREDRFPHLAYLSPEALLQRRVEISNTLKTLEQEKSAIDEELIAAYGAAELRRGVRVPGGWVLTQRTRSSWIYPAVIKDQIRGLQLSAQASGEATQLRTTYLALNQEEAG